jgi:hypothetical protein
VRAAIIGVAQEEEEEGIDQQDIFDRVILFLAALTRRLFSRVLGADDAAFHPVERGRKGRDQELKLVEGQAGEIQERCRARLQISSP